ncbi:MAG: winged helix-turn-helix domain-containing protein [Dehalococcoidia bacterium]|tara:strand:- start:36 stop:308 length:273 start_codon:yes stop_codon:yes gene_type:complete
MLEVIDDLYQISYRDSVLNLRPKEYDLLKVLIENTDKVLSKSDLIRQIWPDKDVRSRVVDTNISRLRTKLKESGHPGILVVNKRGYRLIE